MISPTSASDRSTGPHGCLVPATVTDTASPEAERHRSPPIIWQSQDDAISSAPPIRARISASVGAAAIATEIREHSGWPPIAAISLMLAAIAFHPTSDRL